MTTKLLLIAALALGGCATTEEEPDEVVLDQASIEAQCVVTERDLQPPQEDACEGKFTIVPSEWSTKDMLSIVAAVANWNAVLGVEYVSLTAASEHAGWCDIKIAERDGTVLASYVRTEASIHVDIAKVRKGEIRDRRQKFQIILQHEIGHSLGLRHREDGVMCSVPWVSPEFTQTDVEQIALLNVK